MGRAMERLAANNHYNPNSYCDVVLIWDFAPASLSSMLNLLTENKMQTVCGPQHIRDAIICLLIIELVGQRFDTTVLHLKVKKNSKVFPRHTENSLESRSPFRVPC